MIILFSGGGSTALAALLQERTKDFLNTHYNHENEILIPSLGMRAPFVESASWSGDRVLKTLENGVVMLPTNNWLSGDRLVVTAHSSGTVSDGKESFIFSSIGQLRDGASIFMWHDNKLAKYVVKGRKIVSPYDVKALKLENEHTLTLVTCWPIGDNRKRILVFASKS